MLFEKKSISSLLYGSISMIETATKDPVIHSALLAMNFTDPKFDALRTTWSIASEATKAHKKAVDDQKEKYKKNGVRPVVPHRKEQLTTGFFPGKNANN